MQSEELWVERATGSPRSRYELIEEIGRGGMGVVYRAVDHELEEVIAIKLLTPGRATNQRYLQRFKHELKVARRLTHPNITRLHDLIELNGCPCLSMELVEGEGLDTILRRSGRLSPDQAIAYTLSIVSALELAHELSVVHRDLKPANIIIDVNNVPRILDFGIAKSLWMNDAPTRSVVGTPCYMAPEQCVPGSVIDGRGDLYSVGIMLYQMLCGRVPFDHQDPQEIMRMQRTAMPTPPSLLVGTVPARLEQVVMRLLEKEPGRRFQRASDLATALRELQSPRPRGRSVGREVHANLVLVAASEDSARQTLRQHLQQATHGNRRAELDVVEARHGGEALELALQRRPSLILLGMNMPFLDGAQVLRLIRNNAATRATPVILLFDAKRPSQRELSATIGAEGYMSQPFDQAAVDHVVMRFLA